MKRIFLAVMLLAIAGCEKKPQPPPPQPSITVERVDNTEFTGITIYYKNHNRPQNGATYVTLNSPEEIQAYRKQIEFLLNRLEEAEKRMAVHEPESP